MKSKIKLFIMILNVILFTLIIIQLADNTLYLRDVKKEVINTFGKDYIITIHKISEGQFVVSASVPEDKYNLSKYNIKSDKVNRIILDLGYHNEDTKYIEYTTDIDLWNIAISN
ncbi:hypothetical protein AAK964_12230 [Tissierella praeacuta]|uniref:hypothetical protein n=1 Tax=Tissierella praeacuta TaxID=43131 RepID=UPI003519C008